MIGHAGEGSGGDTRADNEADALLETQLGGAIGDRRATRGLVREGPEHARIARAGGTKSF